MDKRGRMELKKGLGPEGNIEYRTRTVEVCRITLILLITSIRKTSKFLVQYSIFDIPTGTRPLLEMPVLQGFVLLFD